MSSSKRRIPTPAVVRNVARTVQGIPDLPYKNPSEDTDMEQHGDDGPADEIPMMEVMPMSSGSSGGSGSAGYISSAPSRMTFDMPGKKMRSNSYDRESRVFIPSVDQDPDVISPSGGAERDDLAAAVENINVHLVDAKTLVLAVVVNVKDDEKNTPTQVKAKGSIPIKGLPYNNATDSYTIRCVDLVDLGAFGFGMRIEVKDAGNFSQNIPIPGQVLERKFSAKHKEIIALLKTKYPAPSHKIQYLQMLEAN